MIGVDISSWQTDITTPQKVDFVKMKDAGCSFVFMRAFFGLSKDRDFGYYWESTKNVGLPRGAYMFPITSLSITEQTKAFVNLLKQDKGEIYPVLDVEAYKGSVHSANELKTSIKIIEDGLGTIPMIYTGYYVWRDSVAGSNDAFFKKYPLWIATYATKPMVPPPFTTWLFWQTSDKGDGLKYGVESKNIDLDYFNGTQEDFNKLFGTNVSPVDPDPIDVVSGVEYTALSQMNVRTGPGINYPVYSTLPAGTKLVPQDIGGNDAWIKIGEDLWVCKSLNGKVYLQ